MALSAPRAWFGCHSFTPYSRTDGTFYGTVKVLNGSSISLQGELIDLMGGSQKYPWAVEEGAISAEMSIKVGEYPDFLFTLFLGKAPTALTAESTGNVSTLTNVLGTTVMNVSNGISGVAATSSDEADLKFGKYICVAVSANTFDLYFSSDADIGRGTNGTYSTDALKVSAALSVAAGNAVEATFGLTFTKVGTPAFTTGDTAEFYVRPVAVTGGMTVNIGGSADQSFPEFGAILMAQKRGNQELVEIEAFRCKAAGMPLGFEMNKWAESELKAKVMYDSAKDKILTIRAVKPSGTS